MSWTNANIEKNSSVDLKFDLNELNKVDKKYDTIICNQVLGDVKNPQFSINELGRTLKKNGCLILTESLLNEEHDEPNDYFRFTEYGIRQLLDDSSFEYDIEYFEKRGKYFSVAFQFLNRILINRLDINDNSNKIVRKIFYMYLQLNTKVALFLDSLMKHKSYESFYLGWIIVARKVQ